MTLALRERPITRPQNGQKLLTAADLNSLPETLPSGPVRYELWKGVLKIMTPPGFEHGGVEWQVVAVLAALGQQAGHGKGSSGECGVQLGFNPDTVVGADAVFLTNDQLPPRISPEGWLLTIPALIVEVLSKNDQRNEVQRKVEAYLEAGARLVWVVDPPHKTIRTYRPDQPMQVLRETDTLSADGIIPGLSVPVSQLFE